LLIILLEEKKQWEKERKKEKGINMLLHYQDCWSGTSLDSPVFIWEVAREWWHTTSSSKHEKHYQV